ncbi:MAG: tRNA (adenosine(37)-N6)-threonylcarbamoyltransferase complex ATPase subunit type 1 TsaE [Cyanobacterium sp. T60_A2020_053]|nr:tRNA (adenosine(37)-N6)-threonylcarbamoyltransferase complex ATPase subunit type 1 TsaE [Cyanobacterium sp. T60_A2020_053]
MIDSQTYFLKDDEETKQLGYNLSLTLTPNTVILLRGEMGAGKTTLIQGVGAGLGITEAIVSPTFTLVNEYLEGRIPLYHIDLYRLDGEEIADLRLENYWQGREVEAGITAIEWAQLLPYFPDNYLLIDLTLTEDGGRKAVISV